MKGFLIVVLMLSSIQVFAEQKSLLRTNFKWVIENYSYIEDELRTGKEVTVVPIINTIGMTWANKDGAVGSDVAPLIAQAMLYQTRLMLLWFSDNEEVFERFMLDVKSDLFTDYSGGRKKELEKLKGDLILQLEKFNAQSSEEEIIAINDKVLVQLRSVKIRVVD